MVSLINLVSAPLPPRAPLPPPTGTEGEVIDNMKASKLLPIHRKSNSIPQPWKHLSLRKIIPSTPCRGSINFRNVTFAYPARPTVAALNNISLFIPANETTYIVGPSGSGKSSIAALLARLYSPQYGSIDLDDQSLAHLNLEWTRANIFHVSQNTLLFPMSIADNVAMGLAGSLDRRPEDITREEVVAACRASLMHEFVRDLENGYDTLVGNGGLGLSGGQKQRLALARARVRDPAVLILDEATSALDPTSRSLILSALKAWRKNRTTIIITHDLSMIEEGDFVYVMDSGTVAECGFREELDRQASGVWQRLIQSQGTGDDLMSISEADVEIQIEDDESHHRIDVWTDNDTLAVGGFRSVSRASYQSVTDNIWSEYLRLSPVPEGTESLKPNRRVSAQFPHVANPISPEAQAVAIPRPTHHRERTLVNASEMMSFHAPTRLSAYEQTLDTVPASASSLHFTHSPQPRYPMGRGISPPVHPPLSHIASTFIKPTGNVASLSTPNYSVAPPAPPTSTLYRSVSPRSVMSDTRSITSLTETVVDDSEFADIEADVDAEFESDKRALERTALAAKRHYHLDDEKRMRIRHSAPEASGEQEKDNGKRSKKSSKEKSSTKKPQDTTATVSEAPVKLSSVLAGVYQNIPKKYVLFLGVLFSLISGAMTPLFSFLLSKLLFEVSVGAQDISVINIYGGIVLIVAFADGLFNGLKYFTMEICSLDWIQGLRRKLYVRILEQDKRWFDKHENRSEHLVHVLFKEGDDAKLLIGVILGQSVVVISMLGLGLIWALVLGWQLTLAGFAIGPIFAGVMSVQATLVDKFQRQNRECREEVAKGYYETISNIRQIRSMAFEARFKEQFEISLTKALHAGVKGAFVEGCNVGVASGLIYLAEGLLFWVGAVLVARDIYTYARMVQVLQLVVFSVSIASQLLAFTGSISKALQATRELHKLLMLSDDTDESKGKLQPDIIGNISFDDVRFAYPERPTDQILRGVNLTIKHGEMIALVGSSGSGKSTLASLLQRMYNPTSGTITVEGNDISATSVEWLRDRVSIVPQTAQLFDMPVIDNIAYGGRPVADEEAYRAAKQANAEEFILDLPDGYETALGQNADLLSGGQIQRLSIARSLVRGAKVLILDECTSALDPANQSVVLDAIRGVRAGRTIIMITHKLPVMRMCDRIVVMDDGIVAEQGTYEQLVHKKGVFAQLANGGEWLAE